MKSLTTCYAKRDGDTLIIGNSLIQRTFDFCGGLLRTRTLTDLTRGITWTCDAKAPDCILPGETNEPSDGQFAIESREATAIAPGYLAAIVTVKLGELELRRTFRIHPDCPAIACDYDLRGKAAGTWRDPDWPSADPQALESFQRLFFNSIDVPVLDRLALDAPHLSMTAARFLDATDFRNTLVHAQKLLPFVHPMAVAGNVLLIDDVLTDRGLFVISEGPCTDIRLGDNRYDFVAQRSTFHAVGLGLSPSDLREGEWVRGYGCVVGVAGDGELGRMEAMRRYQQTRRTLKVGRDEMIMLNTWGDRSQDTRLGESFALAEIEAGKKFGVTHLQLDDGWQQGVSHNSATKGGIEPDLGADPTFWHVHPRKFPNGLAPVIEHGKKHGIEICLWFQPSDRGHYRLWEQDAATLIDLYNEHGIRTFKIDGVSINDKAGDENLRAMFDRVLDATDHQAVFNLDVTNGTRFGYHYFNEYGNLFLENRYTDFTNYYPHWSLRNLWMLSRWVRPEQLQIECLNIWRNADKYPANDPLAPANVPFDYCFATTLASQPLAWFEASNLPDEAFAIAPMIQTYREHQASLHAGRIYPIGHEPSGTGWTGFQSINDDGGYLIIYREYNDAASAKVRTWFEPGRAVRFKHVLGHGADFEATADDDGAVMFTLPDRFTFAMYRYD